MYKNSCHSQFDPICAYVIINDYQLMRDEDSDLAAEKHTHLSDSKKNPELGAIATTDAVTGELAWTTADRESKALLPTTIAALGFLHNNPSEDWVQVFTISYAGGHAQFGYCFESNQSELVASLEYLSEFDADSMHGATVHVDVVNVENPEDLPDIIDAETVNTLGSKVSGKATRFSPGEDIYVTRKHYEQDEINDAFMSVVEHMQNQ